MTKRIVNKIIVHCADTPENKEFTIDDIRKWHVEENGWIDVGYHLVVHLDGTVHTGRDFEKVGAHCRGHNEDSIGICYIGGRDFSMEFAKDTRTEEQKESMLILLKYLKNIYLDAKIHSHSDFADKACPSFDATAEYSNL